MQHHLLVVGLYTIIEIEMRDIAADQHQIAAFVSHRMAAYMAGTISAFNINQFVLRMKMPVEQIVESRIAQQAKGNPKTAVIVATLSTDVGRRSSSSPEKKSNLIDLASSILLPSSVHHYLRPLIDVSIRRDERFTMEHLIHIIAFSEEDDVTLEYLRVMTAGEPKSFEICTTFSIPTRCANFTAGMFNDLERAPVKETIPLNFFSLFWGVQVPEPGILISKASSRIRSFGLYPCSRAAA